MRRSLFIVLFLALFAVHVLTLTKASGEWKALPREGGGEYVIPSSIVKITSLEFDGLASDFLFLKSLVFLGSTLERTGTPKVNAWEWKWLYNVLDASTGLDPYFLDPYYIANANLTWGGGLVEETNVLLEKGSRYRYWDWQLLFFRGFNCFFFLKNNNEAAQSLLEASRRHGADPLYGSLAAKLIYKENNTETSILLLEELAKTTDKEVLKKVYADRLDAMKSVLVLEKAVAVYKKRFGRTPVKIEELIRKRVLSELPRDPYGGKYYIDPQGDVRTTKESMLLPYQH